MWEEAKKENRGPMNRAGWKREVKVYITISHKTRFISNLLHL